MKLYRFMKLPKQLLKQFTGKKMERSFLSGNLLKMENVNLPSAEEFAMFKREIGWLIKLDLTNYKDSQMNRRIVSIMNKNGANNLSDYLTLLKCNENCLEEFVNMITINVSEFFRNREKFVELEKVYLQELLSKKYKLNIWSAGCSIGAEIYSVAMMLDKYGVLNRCDFLATDFDENIINRAKSGIFCESEISGALPEYKRYFQITECKSRSGQQNYQINPNLCSKVRFEKHNLLSTNYQKGFDLIICRNVVIYFTEETRSKVYKQFYDSLNPGGILFIGSTERVNHYNKYGYNLRSNFFYQK